MTVNWLRACRGSPLPAGLRTPGMNQWAKRTGKPRIAIDDPALPPPLAGSSTSSPQIMPSAKRPPRR